MVHSLVVAKATDGDVHYFRVPGNAPEARETFLAMLRERRQFTDEFGRIYAAWEIDSATVQEGGAEAVPSAYPPFGVDGKRIGRLTR